MRPRFIWLGKYEQEEANSETTTPAEVLSTDMLNGDDENKLPQRDSEDVIVLENETIEDVESAGSSSLSVTTNRDGGLNEDSDEIAKVPIVLSQRNVAVINTLKNGLSAILIQVQEKPLFFDQLPGFLPHCYLF